MAQQPEFMTAWVSALLAHWWAYNPRFTEFGLASLLMRGQIPLPSLARQPVKRALAERAKGVVEQ